MSKSILSFFKKSDTNSGSNVESVNNPDDAILPRKRKSPNYKSLNDFFIVEGQSSKAQPYFPSSSKEHYRAIFFEVLDLIINSIQSRFDQPSFKVFLNLQSLLI